MNRTHHKVFNIGFHKTGTTSLTQFMHDLGYKSLHSVALSMELLNFNMQSNCGEDSGKPGNFEALLDNNIIDKTVREYDFFSDNPWPFLYEYLDRTIPDSKFILTLRDNDSWINSLVKHSGNDNTLMRQLIYGYGNPTGHVKQYRKIYIRHNKKAQEYFRNKNNMLAINIAEDDKVLAERIVNFLGLDNPGVAFPIMNKMRTL